MDKKTCLIHEAGHATLAIAGGLPFLFVAQSGDRPGLLQLGLVTHEQLKNKRFREAYAITATAGAMAEGLRFGGGGLQSLDSGLGQTDCANLAKIGMTLNEILSACYQSEKYLKAHWPAVQSVASALKDCPMLLESDVRAAAGALPALFEPESKPVSKNLRQSFKASTKSLWMKQTAAFQAFGG